MLPYWGHDEEELSEYLCRTTPSLHWSSNWCSPIKAQAVWKTLNPEGPPTSTYCQAIVKPLSIWCLLQTQVLQRREEHHPPGTRRSRCRIFWMHNTTCTTQSLLNVSRFLFHDFHAISLYLQHNPHLESLTIVDYRWLSLPIAECRSPVIYQGCAGTCRGIWFVRTGSEIGAWRLVEILDEIWWDMQCKKCSETVTAMSKPWDAMDSIG